MEVHALSPDDDLARLERRLAAALVGLRSVGSVEAVGLLRVDVDDRLDADDASARLRAAVRPGDTVAVEAPGRFLVLCDRLGHADDVVAIAERIAEGVGPEATITVAALDPWTDDPASLLRGAEGPDGSGGGSGGGLAAVGWQAFDDELRARAARRDGLERALRATRHGEELVLHYQPEIDLATGRIAAVEALVRWDRGGEVVPPDSFISLAEETGLIVPIGSWVLREACEQLARWRAEGIARDVSVAVNVSPRQLVNAAFVDDVAAVLADTGIGAGSLCLELTETVMLVELRVARALLGRLRELGVRIAVDDFGTGHSSLTYLHELPIDAVKLDQSFVDGLDVDVRRTQIVEAVVALIRAVGLDSVAEGITDERRAHRLRDLGCTLGQGSWISPPLAPDDLAARLARPSSA